MITCFLAVMRCCENGQLFCRKMCSLLIIITEKGGNKMQDENQENVQNEVSEKEQRLENERWAIAFSALKEAVADAGIKDISEYNGEPLELRWRVFSVENDQDIILKLQAQGLIGVFDVDISLILAARLVLDEVEKILTQPDATRIFDFEEKERREILHDHTRMILKQFVTQIPIVSFRNITQALDDSIQGHIKTSVEPLLKEHWESVGLPNDFTVSPSAAYLTAIKGVNEHFNVLREGFVLGNKRARLTDERRANLDVEHELFRSEYQHAQNQYKYNRKQFFVGHRNRTEDEWEEEWLKLSFKMFPDLNYDCRKDIISYKPHELSCIHLADFYGHSPSYMAKLISQASGLRRKKPQ